MMYAASAVSSSADSRWNSKCWVRLRIVGSTFCGSVVASTNTTCSGGLLERLQQRVRRRRRQHVDLVEDVHLGATRACPAPPCAMRSRMASTPLLEAASSSWTSKRRAVLDGDARLAHAARLAVDRVLAVEDLGQDAGRGRLARAAGAAEQVGVADPVVAHGVAQGRPRGAPGPAPRRSAAAGSGGRATGRPSAARAYRSPTTATGRQRTPAAQGNGRSLRNSRPGRPEPEPERLRDRQDPLPHVMVRRSAAHARSR